MCCQRQWNWYCIDHTRNYSLFFLSFPIVWSQLHLVTSRQYMEDEQTQKISSFLKCAVTLYLSLYQIYSPIKSSHKKGKRGINSSHLNCWCRLTDVFHIVRNYLVSSLLFLFSQHRIKGSIAGSEHVDYTCFIVILRYAPSRRLGSHDHRHSTEKHTKEHSLSHSLLPISHAFSPSFCVPGDGEERA